MAKFATQLSPAPAGPSGDRDKTNKGGKKRAGGGARNRRWFDVPDVWITAIAKHYPALSHLSLAWQRGRGSYQPYPEEYGPSELYLGDTLGDDGKTKPRNRLKAEERHAEAKGIATELWETRCIPFADAEGPHSAQLTGWGIRKSDGAPMELFKYARKCATEGGAVFAGGEDHDPMTRFVDLVFRDAANVRKEYTTLMGATSGPLSEGGKLYSLAYDTLKQAFEEKENVVRKLLEQEIAEAERKLGERRIDFWEGMTNRVLDMVEGELGHSFLEFFETLRTGKPVGDKAPEDVQAACRELMLRWPVSTHTMLEEIEENLGHDFLHCLRNAAKSSDEHEFYAALQPTLPKLQAFWKDVCKTLPRRLVFLLTYIRGTYSAFESAQRVYQS